MKHFFERPHHILGGKAKTYLEDRNDLVALKVPEEVDYLSNFLRRHWVSEVDKLLNIQTH